MNEQALSKRFKRLESQYSGVGKFIILSMAVRGMRYNRQTIYESFNKYVPKADYAPEEKDTLMDILVSRTSDGEPTMLVKTHKKTL